MGEKEKSPVGFYPLSSIESFRKSALGTVASVNPRRAELFAIRILCLHRKGIQSFEELRTVGDIVHPTFVDAAKVCLLFPPYFYF